MSELSDLYQEVILDHNRRPRNCYQMECASRQADGHNPLCGDVVKVYLRVDDGVVEEISFQGDGCAICTASCSMMSEAVKGKTVEEAKDLHAAFHYMLTGIAHEQSGPGAELGKLRVFEGVREYPVRVKCATLAWHTLSAAIDGEDAVTTE
jgi:nitrogen fixation protein NifU and related proteins